MDGARLLSLIHSSGRRQQCGGMWRKVAHVWRKLVMKEAEMRGAMQCNARDLQCQWQNLRVIFTKMGKFEMLQFHYCRLWSVELSA